MTHLVPRPHHLLTIADHDAAVAVSGTNVYMSNPTNQIESLTVEGDVVESGGNKTVNIVES